jgi:hypothetical protein
MKNRVFLIILVLTISGLVANTNTASKPTSPGKQNATQNSHPSITTHEDDAGRKEQKAIKRFAGYVSRKGDKLIFKVAHGKPVVLLDDPHDNDSYCRFIFVNFLGQIGYYLVEEERYELSQYRAINSKNGKQKILEDLPVISPDKKRIAVASLGVDSDSKYNGIFFYRLSGDSLRTEKVFLEDDVPDQERWGPSDAHWIDNKTVEFTKNVPLPESHGMNFTKSPMVARWKYNSWYISEKK